MIRIAIADDMDDIRSYFKIILSREKDFQLVGQARNSQQIYAVAKEQKPDIILMDIQMENEHAGINATKKIKQDFPNTKVIMLTIHEEDDLLFQAYAAGAQDYILKTDSIADILTSIRSVSNNTLALKPAYAEKILTEFSRLQNANESLIYTLNILSNMTNAEMEVLHDLTLGLSKKQIAQKRVVEEVTIRTQINRILKKFECKDINQVVKVLSDLRIFDIYKK